MFGMKKTPLYPYLPPAFISCSQIGSTLPVSFSSLSFIILVLSFSMASKVIFDTHTYVKRLTATGFTEEQAEVQAETLSDLIENGLVTREYLDMRLKELEMKLKELELRLTNTLTLRLGGMLVAGIVIVASLVKLL